MAEIKDAALKTYIGERLERAAHSSLWATSFISSSLGRFHNPLKASDLDIRMLSVPADSKFWMFCKAGRQQRKVQLPDDLFQSVTYLALDPGETTGVAIWVQGQIWMFELDTRDLAVSMDTLASWLRNLGVDHVRYEDYRVYSWKTQDHSNAALHTPQWIGCIKAICGLLGYSFSSVMAQQAKNFWTDDKLKLCGFYVPGLKHGRDALRHLLFYMCFPTEANKLGAVGTRGLESDQ